MPNVLIAAVGEEPTPNLIPIFAEAAGSFDYVQFMLSGKPEVQRVAENLTNAIRKDSSLAPVTVIEPGGLDAWEIAAARRQIAKTIDFHGKLGRAVTVNVTGGTKIMSIASLEAARKAGVPAIYVNTEREEIIHLSPDGGQKNVPFRVCISIETQLRAAGRELSKSPKPPIRAEDVDPQRAHFAEFLLANFKEVREDLVRQVLASCGDKLRLPVSIVPEGSGREAARRAHEAGLWYWDEGAGTITIASEEARKFLRSGFVEIFALTALDKDKRFDEVLGNVKIVDFSGELDVVVSRNGRLGIVECKLAGEDYHPLKISFVAAKMRLHEVILCGPYAASMFAFGSDIFLDHNRERIFTQYEIPVPLLGKSVYRLADEMCKRLAAI